MAICCHKKDLIFTLTNEGSQCLDVPGSSPAGKVKGGMKCAISVCGNGKPPSDGIYCGVRSCNIFGCNCSYGCIPGLATTSFLERHEEFVNVVYTTWLEKLISHIFSA